MYSRLTIFIDFHIRTHQISRSHSTIYITPCLTLPIYHTSSISFYLCTTSTNYYQKSFFPHTIADWNNLPDEIIDSTNLDDFSYCIKFFMLLHTPCVVSKSKMQTQNRSIRLSISVIFPGLLRIHLQS